MEEKLKNKIREQYNFYTKRNKTIFLALLIIFAPILVIVTLILGIQNSGWSGVPIILVKLIFIISIGGFIFYKLITWPYRRLNRKNYYFFEGYVNKKKYVDEHIEFVGIENEMRRFEKTNYLLLDNDEYYTKAESWAFRDVRENERYLFAAIGKNNRRKCIIVGALKLD